MPSAGPSKSQRNRIALVRLGMIVLLALTVKALTSWEWWFYYKFDQKTWAEAKPERHYYMAQYLVEEGVIQTWSREKILTSLGDPDPDRSRGRLLYNLGPERGFISIDYAWLEIDLEDDGRVKKAVIRPG